MVVGHRWIRPVGGQLQTLGQPGERLLPIRQLTRNPAVWIGRITQIRPLPQRVIRILHRKRRPVGSQSHTPARVGHPDVTHEPTDRPAITGNVMDDRNQHMFAAHSEKGRSQRDLRGQVEAVSDSRANRVVESVHGPVLRVDDLPPRFGLPRRHHDLSRHTVDRREHRAKRLVALHHIGQCPAECIDIQPAADPVRGRHVVDR